MEQITLDFFAKLTYPRALKAGPGGALAFATKRANLEKNSYDSALWVYWQHKLRRLGGSGAVQGHWWWDAAHLLVASGGGPAEKALARRGLPVTVLRLLPLKTGEKGRELLRVFLEVEDVWPLAGGGLLLLAQWDPAVDAAMESAEGDAKKAAELLDEQRACTAFEELPLWENGGGVVAGKRRRLYHWDGQNLHPLSGETTEVLEVYPAANGEQVYCIAKTYDAVAPVGDRLYRLTVETGERVDITFKEMRHDACLPLEGGGVLVVGSDMKAHGLNQNPAFYRLDGDGAVTILDDSGRYGVYSSVGTDVDMAGGSPWQAVPGGAVFLSTMEDSSQLMFVEGMAGGIRPITCQPGAVSEAVAAEEGCFYAIAMRGGAGPEVYRVSPDGAETPLTHLNDVSGVAMSEMRPLTAASDGENVRGWVMLPPGATPAQRQKIPGILYIHGGPKTVYGPVLFHEMQYWAAQGYAVVLCNPAGSDGRGDDFADIRGDYGGRDCRGILAFADAALAATPCIDDTRLGVAGGSYGGFMVNWLVCHTGRFAAAVSQRGISNWVTMALLSDIGYYFVPDQAGAAVLDDPDGLMARSPLAQAHAATTPTLFLHSDEDYRCPLAEGMQLYSALRLGGVQTRLVVFHGENHHLSRAGRPQNRVRRVQEMTDWFARFLR